MTYPEGFNFMPGAVHLSGATDPDVRAENECRQVGPIHYCPGQSIGLGHAGDGPQNDTGIGLVFVPARGGVAGLSVAMTPKSMRSFAEALCKMADMIDATAAELAAAALARATGAGK